MSGYDAADADCHYGDHFWGQGGVCSNCGKRFRCGCGQFVRVDGLDEHMKKCPQWLNAEVFEVSSLGEETTG